jgi:DNA invertase Pin-like site-specific DNA recombinase
MPTAAGLMSWLSGGLIVRPDLYLTCCGCLKPSIRCIAFVSLSEQIDTTTPAGKMVFTVLGAVAELERSLIVERVKAGLRNARAKGKRLGRPRVSVDARRICALRAEGLSWAAIAERLAIGEGTVYRAAHASAKNPARRAPVSVSERAAD